MTNKSLPTLKKELKAKIDKAGEFWLDKQPAVLGNYAGTVKVPGTSNMVYCRLANGQVVQAFNTLAPNIRGWKVFVGRDKSQPNLFRVIEVRWAYNLSETVAYVLFHHEQHEYPAPDTVWVRRDQFMPLLVLPGGGFTVRLYGDIIYTAGMTAPLHVADNMSIDLSSYVSTGGAYYVLVEVRQNGTLNYVQGDAYGSLALLRTNAPIPTPTSGSFPVAAIEFYEGQTEIRRDDTQRNIIDLRMFTSDVPMTSGDQISSAQELNLIKDGDLLGFLKRDDGLFHSIRFENFKYAIKGYVEQIYAILLSSGVGVSQLDDLTDVTLTGPTDGQVLTYDNGTSQWINADPTGGGGGSPWVYDVLTSQVDGSTTVFTLSGTPIGEVILFYNTTMQSNTEFSVSGTSLTTDWTPENGAVLIAVYDTAGPIIEPVASPALRVYMNQNFTM